MTMEIRKLPAPPGLERVETGPVRFGDDWPGVFIRGDNAAGICSLLVGYVAMSLEQGHTNPRDFALYGCLISHASLLASCDQTGVVAGGVDRIRQRVLDAAALYDMPTEGGTQ